jgi:uncharacterized protein (DUF924 family)
MAEPGAAADAWRADYAALAPAARAVLDCWFGEPDSPVFGQERKFWFSRDAAVDAMLRERFGELIERANQDDDAVRSVAQESASASGQTGGQAIERSAEQAKEQGNEQADERANEQTTPRHWQTTPLGALALIILLDQFSRNCHRNTPRAFAADRMALQVAQRLVANGWDRMLPSAQHRAFAYLPFEHDETLDGQRESLRLFGQLRAEPGGQSYYRFAERHAQIIQRFGRFPHRNALLGRTSTAEEIAFLREPGSSF